MNFETLIQNLQVTHNTFYSSAAKAVNTAMTVRNWLYGYYIVEYEQNGEDRAKYGARLLKELSDSIHIKGISETNLKTFRQFYLTYPVIGQALPDLLKQVPIIQTVPEQSPVTDKDRIRQALPGELQAFDIRAIQVTGQIKHHDPKPGLNPARLLQTVSFSHIVELLKIDDPLKRAFYEIECVKGTWSTRELHRQVESLYFERSGLSKDKKKLSEIVNLNAVQLTPRDVLNNRNRNTYRKGMIDPPLAIKLHEKYTEACKRAAATNPFNNPGTNMHLFIEELERVKNEKEYP